LTALDGGNITTGLITDARLSANIPRLNQQNTFAGDPQMISGAGYGRLLLRNASAAANQRSFQIISIGNQLQFQPTDDTPTGLSNALILDRFNNALVGADIYEKGRTTPLGHWIAIAYSAGLFSANTGTWTVEAGDFSGMAYTVMGKTMLLTFVLNTT